MSSSDIEASDSEGSEVIYVMSNDSEDSKKESGVQSNTGGSGSAVKLEKSNVTVTGGDNEEQEEGVYSESDDETVDLSPPLHSPTSAVVNRDSAGGATETEYVGREWQVGQGAQIGGNSKQANRGSGQFKTSIVAQRAAASRISARLAQGTVELEDDFLTGQDTLTHHSRNLYEKTKFKILISVIYGVVYLFVLGMCAQSGGMAEGFRYQQKMLEKSGADTMDIELYSRYQPLDVDQLSILKRAYGFSSFCTFIGSCLVLWAAVRISPFLCGATGEAQKVTHFQMWNRKKPDGKYEQVVTKERHMGGHHGHGRHTADVV